MKKTLEISKERMYEVLRKPIITEKTASLGQFNKIAFRIAKEATKQEVKLAVEKVFKVKVMSVNTINVKGKNKTFKGVRGVRNDYKKAIVTLQQGQTIDFAAGV